MYSRPGPCSTRLRSFGGVQHFRFETMGVGRRERRYPAEPVQLSERGIGLFMARTPDLVTPKLAALLAYQLSLRTPTPPK
jgi:hypothetical protein